MNEFIIPGRYSGDGPGLSVMFSGLDQSNYQKLELSIDGSSFFEVMRDEENPFCSHLHTFEGLTGGAIYKAAGHIVSGGQDYYTECFIPAAKAVRKAEFRSRISQKFSGGGVSCSIARPKVRDD